MYIKACPYLVSEQVHNEHVMQMNWVPDRIDMLPLSDRLPLWLPDLGRLGKAARLSRFERVNAANSPLIQFSKAVDSVVIEVRVEVSSILADSRTRWQLFDGPVEGLIVVVDDSTHGILNLDVRFFSGLDYRSTLVTQIGKAQRISRTQVTGSGRSTMAGWLLALEFRAIDHQTFDSHTYNVHGHQSSAITQPFRGRSLPG